MKATHPQSKFSIRRRELRAELRNARSNDRDQSMERFMADAILLDEILLLEFGSLDRYSEWSFNTGGGKKAAETLAERYKALGTYEGVGKADFSPKSVSNNGYTQPHLIHTAQTQMIDLCEGARR